MERLALELRADIRIIQGMTVMGEGVNLAGAVSMEHSKSKSRRPEGILGVIIGTLSNLRQISTKGYTMTYVQRISDKQKRRMWFGWVFSLTILAIMSSAASGDLKRQRLPVPVSLGDRIVKSHLVIECDVEDYDMPFSAFRNSAVNPDITRVGDFLSAVRRGNTYKAKALSKAEPGMGRKNVSIEGNLSVMQSHLTRIGISLDLSNLQIRRRIYWGNREYFTYKVADANLPQTHILGFDRDPNEGLLWSQGMEGFEIMLWHITKQRSKYPQDYDIEQSDTYKYRFALTPQGAKHQVNLLFSGRIFVPGITRDEDKPHLLEAALSFYETAMMRLKKAGSLQEFREIGNTYYDAYSKKRFLGWIDSDYQAFLQWINDLVAREREVVFVMDANPIYIIFYRPKGTPDWYIKHDYVFIEKGKFFITRIAFGDELREYFGGRKKFIEPFLMPLIKSDVSTSDSDKVGNPTP